jgi:hypothetical protein
MESTHRQRHDRKRRHDRAGAESEEPRGIDQGIADADKKVRTGSTDEKVRNTPPAGDWNDTTSD